MTNHVEWGELHFGGTVVPMRVIASHDPTSRGLTSNSHAHEPYESEVVHELLSQGDRNNLVIDIGCHIGYYAVIASLMGYRVLAIDANREALDCLRQTIDRNHISLITVREARAGKQEMHVADTVEWLKADVEGDEAKVVHSMNRMFEEGRVRNAMMEISPQLNGSYPGLIRRMREDGFSVYDLGLSHIRRLDLAARHMGDLRPVDVDRIEEYLPALPRRQTNFLFRRRP